MANQMIALGVRGPQLPNLAGAAAQYGNMMANMAVMKEKQADIQRANAFRQLVSDPGFDPANPEHIKAAASLNPEGAEQIARSFDARRKSQQDYTMVEVKRLRDIGAAVGDEAGYQDWLARVEKVSPGDAAAFRQFSPNFDPAKMSRIIMEADQYINKTIATPTASVQVSPTGTLQAVTVGGIGEPSAKEIPEYRYVPDQPTPAAGAAPAAAGQAAPAGGLTPEQAAPILRGASETQTISPEDADRVRRSMGPNGQAQFNQWMRSNNIQITPMSFGGEGMGAGAIQPLTMETAPQIIQTAVQNGVIDQSHVEQLRQMVGPENDQALANWMRQNNVRIQPTGAPSMRTAVYRQPAVDYFAPLTDDGGMPFGGPAAALRQNIGYEPTGRAAQAKPPLQSPLPGSAIVPLPRVRAEAEAGRPSETEIYGKRRAEDQAASDVKFLEGVGAARESAQTALGVISSMIGDARLNKAGQIEIPRGGRPPHPGFEDVVGATWRPGARFIAGTDAAGFDAYLEQVEGGAFLEAYERLKGTGQITEVEGQKATRAITRMKRSVSEAEFVKAAREFEGIIRSALARADEREARLMGTAPRRTPVQKGANRTAGGATVSDW